MEVRHAEVVVPLVGQDGIPSWAEFAGRCRGQRSPRRRSMSSSRRPRPTVTTTCSRR